MIFVQRRTVLPNPELVVNGDFSTDSDWVEEGTWDISTGMATSDGNGANQYLGQNPTFEIGKTYKITYTVITNTLSANIFAMSGTSAFPYTEIPIAIGQNTVNLTATQIAASGYSLRFLNRSANTSGTISIDNVSVTLAEPEIPQANNLFVTISERLNLTSNKWLLLVFESDQQHTKSKTVLNANSSDVILNERIDKLKLTEGGNSTETTDGTVKISVAGFWQYKIYEQTSATNLDETSSDIVRLLEEGKMTVTDTDELTTVEHTNQVTNFIHLNS